MDLSTKEKEFYESLMAEARANFDPANIDPGIELILKAWESIPDPKMEYQESFEVMNSLSQVYFNLERFDEARKYGKLFCNVAQHVLMASKNLCSPKLNLN